MGKKKRHARRIEAVHAAAVMFNNPNYDNVTELWSLTVFADRYIRYGARGTLKMFGPIQPEPATVLSLVGENRQKWFRP